ncbi:MAG: hypothetical protein AAGC69_14935 [Paracraurococcus sp.]
MAALVIFLIFVLITIGAVARLSSMDDRNEAILADGTRVRPTRRGATHSGFGGGDGGGSGCDGGGGGGGCDGGGGGC